MTQLLVIIVMLLQGKSRNAEYVTEISAVNQRHNEAVVLAGHSPSITTLIYIFMHIYSHLLYNLFCVLVCVGRGAEIKTYGKDSETKKKIKGYPPTLRNTSGDDWLKRAISSYCQYMGTSKVDGSKFK
jgi:hypothetical protein